jgi:23S rRNA (guanosine2251-2'-O)-methyltransferase
VSRHGPKDGATVVYGRNAVREALRGRRGVIRLWAAERRTAAELLENAPKEQVPFELVSINELQELCGSRDHQGVVCDAEPYPYADASLLLEAPEALVVALDQVQDPQNLGAICRSAECGGAAGVVLPERRAAQITPAVCRASAGAVEHLPVARVRNVADYLEWARGKGAWVYGAEVGSATSYTSVDFTGRAVMVLGSEGGGLRPRVKRACDQLVSIPLEGKLASLNVSAAAAILIYEALRQTGNEGSRVGVNRRT